MNMILFTIVILGFSTGIVQAGEVAGKVEFVSGDVILTRDNGQTSTLKIGDAIHSGDTLVSAASSEAHLQMLDEAYLAMRANSKMTIKSYEVRNRNSDNSVLQLFKGSLRIITGWIGQQYPQNYRVNTPVATIGVRGTDHEPYYVAPEDATADQPAGAYDHVIEGSTFLQSDAGQIDISFGNIGFVASAGKPRLLAALPGFFPRGHFDQRINDLKPLLKQRLQERLHNLGHLPLDNLHPRLRHADDYSQPLLPRPGR